MIGSKLQSSFGL